MSLRPQSDLALPDETVRVARAAFPKPSRYMRMRDELGPVFADVDFADLFPQRGRPVVAPWRLALVTVMQFAENLTDRQAADAVRARLDWKYALSLELTDPGFDFSVLSEFRGRLLDGGAEDRLLGRMLELFAEKGLVEGGGRQRTDATHVVGAVRELNRLEIVGETLHAALNVLAQIAPAWLRERVDAGWFERYGERFGDYRLPKPERERHALAEIVGQDGMALLDIVLGPGAPDYLRAVPAVDVLRRVWLQHFRVDADGGKVRWREQRDFPPSALMISSPYDLDVRYSQKRGTEWKGFKVHLTETCEPDRPNLITHVETTSATAADVTALDDIHDGLAEKGLLPAEHLADSAYMSAFELVKGRRRGVEMVGPMRVDTSWQVADPDAFELAQFAVDWETERVTCPMGQQSYMWSKAKGPSGKPTVQANFPKRACQACAARSRCTRSASSGRTLTLHPRAEHEALVAAREHQRTADFKQRYKARSGVEGTISEAAFALGARRARYRGLPKTHLQHIATAAAMNLKRVVAWLDGVPRSGTRVSHFARLGVAA